MEFPKYSFLLAYSQICSISSGGSEHMDAVLLSARLVSVGAADTLDVYDARARVGESL